MTASLRELDRLMRERGGLPSLPEPPPLHKMGARGDNDHDNDDNRSNEKDR